MNLTTQQNQQLWNELVKNEVPCSRPYEGITSKNAKKVIDPHNLLGDLTDKNVLCLASGGGQQSIAFGLLGAHVTVVDFSQEQLNKDRQEAKKHSLDIRTIQADMRDLSQFEDNEFDVVYQPYSINYIPDANSVLVEVSRILKKGGIYHLMFHNPFVHGSWKDACWGSQWQKEELVNNSGYPLSLPYRDGEPITVHDPSWNFENLSGKRVKVRAPQEYKHTLSTILNTLIENGFSLIKFTEYVGEDFNAELGTWDHYVTVAPPWFFIWMKKNR